MSVAITILAQADHDAQATPATLENFIVGEAQYDANVTEIALIPNAALTASDTANRIFTLQNRGATGAGTTVIGTLTTNVATGNWTINDEIYFTLSGTAANLIVLANDVLAIYETVTGAGVAHPSFQITVRGARR